MKLFANFFILVLFITIPLILTGQQPIEQLQREKAKLEKEIEFTREKISELQKQQNTSLSELETLTRQIRIRQNLMNNIRRQISVINTNIRQTENRVVSLEKDLEKLREDYARTLRHSYIHHNNYNSLLFVFSARSFNDAYRRMKYLQEYSDFRRLQAEQIRQTQTTLTEEIASLEKQKLQQQELLASEEKNNRELLAEKSELDKQVQELRKQESTYMAAMREKEQETERLNRQIQIMIREARERAEREARERAAEEARRKAEAAGKSAADVAAAERSAAAEVPALTPEARQLSANFESNRTKLPWPVERGSIIRGFGKNPHPVLQGIETQNNGIDISTTPNSEVRAIFDGTVHTIFYNPNFQRCVMVEHGEYFTVYLYLNEVTVSEGQNLTTGQKIGTAFTNPANGATEIQLQIWKGGTVLNPAVWLAR